MDFNKAKDIGAQYFQKGKEVAAKGKDVAVDMAEKSRVEALVLNNKVKLYRAQRQLGAVVYNLAKGREENQPLVDKYVAIIAAIEKEIDALKASVVVEAEPVAAADAPEVVIVDIPMDEVDVDVADAEAEVAVEAVAEAAPEVVAEQPEEEK